MSGSKISIAMAATALLVSVLVATPLGQAAGRLVLPKNSVGAKQLKKNAVTAAKVKNGTLLAADFKAGQLPRGQQGLKGDKGDPGAQGPKGDPGVARVVVRQGGFFSVPANSTAAGSAHCQGGELATGGGPVGLDPGVFIRSSYAGGDTNAPNSWSITVTNTNAVEKSFSITVNCATP